jgi:hypothetical protein
MRVVHAVRVGLCVAVRRFVFVLVRMLVRVRVTVLVLVTRVIVRHGDSASYRG